jgi:hypothetical protein
MILNKLLRPSFDDEKNESGPSFKKIKIDNHRKKSCPFPLLKFIRFLVKWDKFH